MSNWVLNTPLTLKFPEQLYFITPFGSCCYLFSRLYNLMYFKVSGNQALSLLKIDVSKFLPKSNLYYYYHQQEQNKAYLLKPGTSQNDGEIWNFLLAFVFLGPKNSNFVIFTKFCMYTILNVLISNLFLKISIPNTQIGAFRAKKY